MAKKATILDYGMCNLLNVARAFEYCGFDVEISEDPQSSISAERLVVPGVGAFAKSMDELKSRGCDDAIHRFIQSGRPFLGICVGMQMLFDGSDEFGETDGLGILAGRVVKVPSTTVSGERQRVPHIGWNHLERPEHGGGWEMSMLTTVANSHPAVYFVHSFAAQPLDDSIRLADALYGGHRLCAAVKKDNVMATQFHPERSGPAGLEMIRSFGAL